LQGFDGEEFLKCLKHLISIEREWVPYSNKCSLYIRPTLIGTQVRLIGKQIRLTGIATQARHTVIDQGMHFFGQ